MIDHLSPAKLNALGDGELAIDQLASVTEHLHNCPACTSRALEQLLLKSATVRAGHRYAPPDDMVARMEGLLSSHNPLIWTDRENLESQRSAVNQSSRALAWTGWIVAASLLFSAGGLTVMKMNARRTQSAGVERSVLMTEMSDQHIATLAANIPPQVQSSDRHTVKPWFQGKLPFTFNLPEKLPEDTKLDGANLTYLHDRPAAQLLYSVGRHRVSVFVQQQQNGEPEFHDPVTQHTGFHLAGFSTNEIDVFAISDVDPAKLSALIESIEQAQPK